MLLFVLLHRIKSPFNSERPHRPLILEGDKTPVTNASRPVSWTPPCGSLARRLRQAVEKSVPYIGRRTIHAFLRCQTGMVANTIRHVSWTWDMPKSLDES